MPRANRYVEPGRSYHLTHRCHDRSFLFRFAKDRDRYRAMLRERLGRHRILLLGYTITSNHTHLLLRVEDSKLEGLPRFMQSLEGDFAQWYNLRKNRKGAFWEDRYHATMIQDGDHLLRCLRYIDLNMVRSGAVDHPGEWEWTGYSEIMGMKRRNRLIHPIEFCRAFNILGSTGMEKFRAAYQQSIEDFIERRQLERQEYWSGSIAVGSQEWTEIVGGNLRHGRKAHLQEVADQLGIWTVRDVESAYDLPFPKEAGAHPNPQRSHSTGISLYAPLNINGAMALLWDLKTAP